MIVKRNLLCIKQREQLELGNRLLYDPYKNILQHLKELCTDIYAKDFDPVSKVFDGLLSVPKDIRGYYESLLGVTSYYHHSQGGKGKFIEKKLASYFETCTLNIELSSLPLWLENPNLHKKKGLFTMQNLSSEEKKSLRELGWYWLGDRDVSTDLGSIIQDEKTMVLVEIKNRIDSGGTAGRREIWTSEKFGIFVDYLKSKKKLFRKDQRDFSLAELLENFGINNLEIYIGVLFDKGDNPATLNTDKSQSFYSSSRQGFEYLRDLIKQSSVITIAKEDHDILNMELRLDYTGLQVKFGALYGDDIPKKLFRKDFPVSDLLLLSYDDIWLSLLITIDERAVLLKYKQNCSTILIDLLKRDRELRNMYNSLIDTEFDEETLKKIVGYLLSKYETNLENKLFPTHKDKIEYLADLIQFLAMTDA